MSSGQRLALLRSLMVAAQMHMVAPPSTAASCLCCAPIPFHTCPPPAAAEGQAPSCAASMEHDEFKHLLYEAADEAWRLVLVSGAPLTAWVCVTTACMRYRELLIPDCNHSTLTTAHRYSAP